MNENEVKVPPLDIGAALMLNAVASFLNFTADALPEQLLAVEGELAKAFDFTVPTAIEEHRKAIITAIRDFLKAEAAQAEKEIKEVEDAKAAKEKAEAEAKGAKPA